LPEPFARWFAARGWTPRAHQLAMLEKAAARRSALLIAPTGAGKTLAGFLPTLVELNEDAKRRRATSRADGLHTLYISPLKALAVDIARNLEQPVADMNLRFRNPHGRHAGLAPSAPAPASAANPADDARTARAPDRVG
jgi:ATP-dependent Lhr-like helicase